MKKCRHECIISLGGSQFSPGGFSSPADCAMRECLTLGPSRCSDRSGAETEGKERVGKESGELEARNGSLLPFFLISFGGEQ